jgi:hypothetical protein
MHIRDTGWKQFKSGMEISPIRIRDADPGKHPGSATLLTNLECKVEKTKNSYQKDPCVTIFS